MHFECSYGLGCFEIERSKIQRAAEQIRLPNRVLLSDIQIQIQKEIQIQIHKEIQIDYEYKEIQLQKEIQIQIQIQMQMQTKIQRQIQIILPNPVLLSDIEIIEKDNKNTKTVSETHLR